MEERERYGEWGEVSVFEISSWGVKNKSHVNRSTTSIIIVNQALEGLMYTTL
jgi:hypothetical protein